ncbi:MAG: flippase-like domain-containing protein [bacterium]|nr:flippase-like domain-containing protein [bacterium]
MNRFKNNIKLIIGLLISFAFMYLAFSKVDFSRMMHEFASAKYIYVFPAIGVMFISYWLRSLRWRYLMEPIVHVKIAPLFSALLIGYMANSFLPAHLGELIRAFIIGKKKDIPSTTVFGTIVTERILDILVLVLLMGVTIIIFPFPSWVRNSGYLLLAGTVVLAVMLLLMKKYRDKSLALISKFSGFLPTSLQEKISKAVGALLDGIVPLKNSTHYIMVFFLTLFIWVCYAASFQFIFYCFDMVSTYSLPWTAALVLLVVTTISVLVPSSPGYVGTYHFLCQLALGFFAVPKAASLSYAFIMHGINFFPVIIAGLILAAFSKMNLWRFYKERT